MLMIVSMKFVRLGVPLLALAGALLPVPPSLVESWYSNGLYPAIQTTVTPITGRVPVALLDIAGAILIAVIGARFVVGARQQGFRRAVVAGIVPIVTVASIIYLLFLAMWGLNYRRVPLEQKLDFDNSRVTPASVRGLGENAVRALNTGYAAAYESANGGATLEASFVSAQDLLRSRWHAATAAPKRSLLEIYFRQAAIDGMTDPIFLEIVINPDTLPFERPFVIAHEWSHLAGYANEAEANFVAWLACLQGDAMAQYSGWIAVYEHVSASLPRQDRLTLANQLAPGPRRDLEASAARYARSSPVVRTAARDVYDSYLRANRVSEGIASYTGVVKLIVGAGLENGKTVVPRVR